MYKRQICLDTETTGFNDQGIFYEGHNIIEIGAIEIINRRITGQTFHCFLKPQRLIDKEAFKIHGISDKFLQNKPIFKKIAYDFINYIKNAEIIIHNAVFDVSFINYEFHLANINLKLEDICDIKDTLVLARKKFPKQNNKLDALCARYNIDTSQRTKHTALLDAELLAKVYIKMTSGQINLDIKKTSYLVNDIYCSKNISNLNLEEESFFSQKNLKNYKPKKILNTFLPLIILYPSKQELFKHTNILNYMKSNTRSLWLELENEKSNDI